jgi:hypothetical protein
MIQISTQLVRLANIMSPLVIKPTLNTKLNYESVSLVSLDSGRPGKICSGSKLVWFEVQLHYGKFVYVSCTRDENAPTKALKVFRKFRYYG